MRQKRLTTDEMRAAAAASAGRNTFLFFFSPLMFHFKTFRTRSRRDEKGQKKLIVIARSDGESMPVSS